MTKCKKGVRRGGRGSKIAKKGVIMYLNGPLGLFTSNFIIVHSPFFPFRGKLMTSLGLLVLVLPDRSANCAGTRECRNDDNFGGTYPRYYKVTGL